MQLPGGRMEMADIVPFKEQNSFEATACREFLEETGIRLSPDKLSAVENSMKEPLDLKNRRYFIAELTDADGVSPSKSKEKQQAQLTKLTEKVAMSKSKKETEMTTAAMTAMREMVNPNAAPKFHVALSSEHVGFMFTKDLALAVRLLTKHSGGRNSQALQMYVASTLQKCFAPLFGAQTKDSRQHPL